MKIKTLELFGFKSFVDRTVFEFPSGITAIVGPNGCGKSNIVDAIRWSMGEMSAKHLRGRSMEDVIFTGSATRPPVNMAEVTLTFSTEDGIVPSQYAGRSEISVTRRVDRDMESEYLINKVPCRLRDVLELFMGTGIGIKAYAIVEQGHISDLVSARPADRRGLIEEAAGITKYKSRKNAALRKLDATQQNLLRVHDIVHEVRRQMSSLERQARRAERYKAVRDELRQLDLDLAARQSRSMDREITGQRKALATLQQDRESLSASIASEEGKAETVRLELARQERELERRQTQLYDLKSEIARHESRIEILKMDRENAQQQKDRNLAEIGRLRAECLAAENDRERIAGDRDRVVGERQAKEKAQAEAADLLAQVIAREASLAEEINRAGDALTATIAEQARVERTLEDLGARRSEASQRAGNDALTLGEERARLEPLEGEIAGARARLEAAVSSGRLIAREREEKSERVLSLDREVSELEGAWHAALDQQREAESRLRSQKEVEAGLEGYESGVQAILARNSEEPARRKQVLGLLAEMIESPAEYEKALEAALGKRVQSIIVQDLDAGLELVKFLKRSGSGRSSFLPLDLRRDEGPAGPGPDPVLAPPLADVIRVKEPYQDLVASLLRRIFVVDTLERAAAIWRSSRFNGTLVTKEGDLLDPSGIMTGGSARPSGGLISRKREVRELEERLPKAREAGARAEAGFTERKKALLSARARLDEAGQAFHEKELEIVTLERTVERLAAEQESIARAIQAREEDTRAAERLGGELVEVTASQRSLEESRSAGESNVTALRERRTALLSDLEGARQEATDLKVETAGLLERGQALEQEVARLGQTTVDSESRIQALQNEVDEAAARALEIEGTLREAHEGLARLMTQHAERDNTLGKDRGGLNTYTGRLATIEAHIQELRHAQQARGEEISKLQLAHTEIELRLQHLSENILEKYHARLEDLEVDESETLDHEAREERRMELRAQLERLGEVSLGAIEEYQELSERYRFLTEQSEDLKRTIESLQSAIQKINRTSRKLFMETFNLVSAKFEETFPRLFNGGKAKLSLTEGEDVLEAGVEIAAQPPGKRLQNVTLLSGGEKTLTAVSLLFAIFQVKPSPFFLLDEVDAALDDANVGRFNTLLREMTAHSQFLLITHNKATIELADTLYGITMEDPGISKVVSVKLH